jgi:phage terminase small subunit
VALTPLSPQRKRFVEAYLANGGNATKAAQKAGYAKKTARSQGARLLTSVDIQQELERRRAPVIAAVEKRTEIKLADVVQALGFIGLSDPKDFFDADGNMLAIKDMPEHARRAIASFDHETKFDEMAIGGEGGLRIIERRIAKLRVEPRTPALIALGKHLGGFREKVDVTDETPGLAIDTAAIPMLSDEELRTLRATVDMLKAAAKKLPKKKRGGRV